MNPSLIFSLVELAISLARTQLESGKVENTLLDIIQTGVRAYEEHTGEPINLNLIRRESPL